MSYSTGAANKIDRKDEIRRHGVLNGIDLIFVKTVSKMNSIIHLEFLNSNSLELVKNAHTKDNPQLIVFGGVRIKAGNEPMQVKVKEIKTLASNPNILRLTILPVGDYSTYVIQINDNFGNLFDPLFSTIEFQFRPGCLNNECGIIEPYFSSPEPPIINYLAKNN